MPPWFNRSIKRNSSYKNLTILVYDNNVYAFDSSCIKSRDAYCRLEYPEEIHSIVEKGYARKISISELVSFYFGKNVNMIQGSW